MPLPASNKLMSLDSRGSTCNLGEVQPRVAPRPNASAWHRLSGILELQDSRRPAWTQNLQLPNAHSLHCCLIYRSCRRPSLHNATRCDLWPGRACSRRYPPLPPAADPRGNAHHQVSRRRAHTQKRLDGKESAHVPCPSHQPPESDEGKNRVQLTARLSEVASREQPIAEPSQGSCLAVLVA